VKDKSRIISGLLEIIKDQERTIKELKQSNKAILDELARVRLKLRETVRYCNIARYLNGCPLKRRYEWLIKTGKLKFKS